MSKKGILVGMSLALAAVLCVGCGTKKTETDNTGTNAVSTQETGGDNEASDIISDESEEEVEVNNPDNKDTYLADGSYNTADIPEEDKSNFQEDETGFFTKGEIKDGYLTITASFIKWSDDYSESTSYPYATRKFKITDDFSVFRCGGECDPEKTTIEDFNHYYANVENRSECRGLGISIVITNGEVKALYIES